MFQNFLYGYSVFIRFLCEEKYKFDLEKSIF